MKIPKEQNPRKYVTLQDGQDFRTIARIMSNNNYRMNHATARNQLILAMQNLLTYVAGQVKGPKMKTTDVDGLLKDQSIHNQLGDILYLAHKGDVEPEEKK